MKSSRWCTGGILYIYNRKNLQIKEGVEITESTETDIEINTSDVSITKGDPEKDIVVDYADTYTDIPTTGSSKVVAVGALAAVCSALAGLIITKKKKA